MLQKIGGQAQGAGQQLRQGQGQSQSMSQEQAMQIIAQLPPERQAQFTQLLQTNPQQAMQLLQQVMQGGQL